MTALYSSVVGDTFSDLVLIFLAIPLASIALQFGPVEFFALYFFSMMLIAMVAQDNAKKGVASAAIGFILGAIGMDPISGIPRLTFGISTLRGGIPLIPLVVGIFGISELILLFAKEWKSIAERKIDQVLQKAVFLDYDASKDKMSFRIFLSTLRATMLGAGVGTFIGALPGIGATMAAYMGYGIGQRFSRHPEKFGHGHLEGIAAPEAANNATCGATFIPLFAFGIPGSATAALFGAAMIMQGIVPGPLMLEENTLIIYTLFITLFYANFFNLGISRLLIPIYSKICMIQARYIVPGIFLFAILGTYASRNSVNDVWLLLGTGTLGIILRKYGFSFPPLILAFIIGPHAEKALRQSLLMGMDDWTFLLSTPIAITLYISSILFVVLFKYIFKRQVLGSDLSD